MKIIGLDGKIIKLSLIGTRAKAGDSRPRSSYHIKARQLISSIFTDYLAEEVHIPNERFFLDFFLPHRKMVVEVHGEQHYKFNPHFHKTKLDFTRQKWTDRKKREFCEINNFHFVELPYYEDEKQWKKRLLSY